MENSFQIYPFWKGEVIMINKEYGFAIIGCGMIANIHVSAIKEIGNTKLIGVYDNNRDMAVAFSEKWNCKDYSSIEDLLADEMVDVVNICVPSGLHAHFIIKCCQAKKHVIVEKPMAITQEQIAEIESAVKENHVKVEVITQLRFTDATKKIKTFLDAGGLGKILSANLKMNYYRSPEYYGYGKSWRGTWAMDGGGALMNQGIHGVDLIQYFMGGVKSITADCRTLLHNIETEDIANALVEYHNGAIGTIQCTTLCKPSYPRTIEIIGEKGTIVMQEDVISEWNVENSQEETSDQISVNASSSPQEIPHSFHKKQIEDLLDSITNERAPAVDVSEGSKAVQIILAAYESSKKGGKVEL